MTLRLDLVVRTSKRKKEARSPQQQRDMADACAKAHGYEIAKVHDSERDESGKTMDRATLHDAMARVRDGHSDGIMVALTDRLGRAPIEEAMTFVRELDGVGVLVLADAGGTPVNLSDPQAETNLVLQLQMARQFWLAMAKRMKQTQTDAVADGKHVARTPIGYERRGGKLYEHPTLGPIIRRTYELAAREGLHAAIDYLREQVPARRWDTDHVRRLLRSPTYLGWSVTGKLSNKKAHDALTTPELWHAAQTDAQPRRCNGNYPLSQLAQCECGGPMVGALQTVKGRTYRRMRCSKCSRTSIRAETFEAYVLAEVQEGVRDQRFKVAIGMGDVDAAKRAWDAAEGEVKEFATDLDFRRVLGREAWRAGAHARREAADEARRAYEALAAEKGKGEFEVPAVDELEDLSVLARFIARTGITITVRPGRGAVDERVAIVDDGDDVSGVLAA
jgi:DNA invertase Pin-like site-specific DNA recombinase